MKPAKGEPRRPARQRSHGVTSRQDQPPHEDYRVGPGRPPREFQFKPGQSGNPNGARPKPQLARDLKALFNRAMNRKVKLRHGERDEMMTTFAAGFEQLATQFAAGDRHARRDVFYYAEKFGIDLAASQVKGRVVDVQSEAELRQALLDRGIPARLLPPIDEPALEPPPDPPLPPDVNEECEP